MQDMLFESLDDSYDIERVESKYPFIYDQWDFKVNGVVHLVRFMKADPKTVGPRATTITFGIRKGLQIRRKIDSVGNIKKYLATVLKAIEQSIDDPTDRLKVKMDGFILVLPTDIYDRFGARFTRIAKLRLLKEKYRVNSGNENVNVGLDDSKVMFITKMGKSLKDAFPKLDFAEEDEDVVSSISSSIVEPAAPVEVDTTLEVPIEEPMKRVERRAPRAERQAPKIVQDLIPEPPAVAGSSRGSYASTAERIKGEDLRGKYTDEELYEANFAMKIYGYFFIDTYKQRDAENTTSLDLSSVSEYSKKFVAAIALGKKSDNIYNASYQEYLAALNLSSIRTNYIFDSYGRATDYQSKEFGKNGLKVDFPSVVAERPARKNVSLKEIVEICKNYKEILGRHGLYSPKFKGSKMSQGRATSVIFDYANLDLKSSIADMITTAGADDIDDSKIYRVEFSSGRTKQVKTLNYTIDNQGPLDVITELARVAMKHDGHFISGKDLLEFNDSLPLFAQDTWMSSDPEYFKVGFFQAWLLTGGSTAQALAAVAADKIGSNSNLDSYWTDIADAKLSSVEKEAYAIARDRIESNFTFIYDETQQYFKEKLKKKYSGYKLKLYRGIGRSVVDSYIPGALESWTTALSTAVRFGKMMQPYKSDEGYTILYAEVPIEDIWASWESNKDVWAGEEDLKGKKEYVVMGGTFASNPISVFNTTNKEVGKSLKPFNEWTIMENAKKLKIVTPSDPDFDEIVNSDTVAKGNDATERDIRTINASKNEK